MEVLGCGALFVEVMGCGAWDAVLQKRPAWALFVEVLGCGAAEATGLGFVFLCCFQPSCVANQYIGSFLILFQKFYLFYSPPLT